MLRYIVLSIALVCVFCSQIGPKKSLSVTIYNNNFAMVKDVRQIAIDKGQSTLFFTDVSSNIQTQTVTFKATTNPQSVRVIEQNFQNNLVNKNSILQKYIEKEVEFYVVLGELTRKVTGTLLGFNSGYIIKTNSGIDIFDNVVGMQFPSLPEGFFTLPTLNWKLSSANKLTTDCEVAYRTTGFSWKADYSLTLNSLQTKADIGGWVTIDNNSGKKYVNAKLKLIAGQVNTVSNNFPQVFRGGIMAMANSAPQFTQKSFADFHLYTLGRPVTLTEASQKQIQFIPKTIGVNIRKYNQISINVGGGSQQKLSASNKIQFINSAQEGLGIPLPAGIFRTFKADESDGSLEFVGEDRIGHTPKNQKITLTTGNAFDIVADKLVNERTNFGDRGGYNAKLSLTVTNHKNINAEINVIYNNFFGDNLKIDWPVGQVPLKKETSTRYSWTKVLKPEETYAFKWSQSYNP